MKTHDLLVYNPNSRARDRAGIPMGPGVGRPGLPFKSLAALAAGLWVAANTFAAGPVGVRFEGNTSYSLGATDLAGAVDQNGVDSYIQGNWNNEVGASGVNAAVGDKDALATTIKVSWSANNTWGDGADTSTPNGKLMSQYLDSGGVGNDNSSPYQFSINANRPEVYVEGLSAWMTAQGAASYDVVVYYDGDGTDGRIGEYWLQQSAGKGADGFPNALGPDLSGHVFLSDVENFSGTFTQVPLTAGSQANIAPGNFMVFSSLSSDNFIVRTEEHIYRAGISAVQIVPRAAIAAPSISAGPASQIKFAGGSATFDVAANSCSLQHQWVKVGAGDVANATNRSLTLNNLALADNGSQYYVRISNGAGSVQSDPATLTVLSVPHDSGFVSVVLSNSPFAYWRFNDASGGLVSDYIGARNGIPGAANANAGDTGLNPNGQFLGFESGNTGWSFQNGGNSFVKAPPLGINTNKVTFVAWVNPSAGNQAQWTTLLLNRTSNSGLTYTDVRNELGYVWNGYYSFHSGIVVPDGQWSMIAMVVEPTQVTLYLVNPNTGLLSAASVRTTAPAVWNGDTTIGTDPSPSFVATRGFSGDIDEMVVFTNSLTSGQILGLYAAGRAAGSVPPVISAQPVSEQIYAGHPAKFTVVASGTGTLTYQWMTNGVALTNGPGISGAQSATLIISNVAASNEGLYSVAVSNPAGTTPSATVALTITTPTGAAYEAAVIAANPCAYWRLGETSGTNAFDNIGGFTGFYGSGAVMGVAGPGPTDFPGFEITNAALQTTRSSPGSWVAAPPLNLNTNTVTITGWFYSYGGQDGAGGLVFSRGAGTVSGLNFNGSSQLSYTWNDDWNWNSGLTFPDNQWVFAAVVIEPTKATLYMGANGTIQYATKTATNPAQSFGSTTYLGGDVAFGDSRIFNGVVDEVAVFSRSLSGGEIVNLYSQAVGLGIPPQVTIVTPTPVAGFPGFTATFTATALGSSPLKYQWYKGTNAVQDGGNISGATTLSLTISNATVNDSGDYTLVATNSAGSATSSISTLSVGPVPSSPYHTKVLAAGPFAYWRLNETTGTTAYDLAGGHNGTYGAAMHLGAVGQEHSGLFGFAPDTEAASFTANTDQSWIDVPALNLNANTVTIMAWVYPTIRPPDWSGIFLVKTPSTAGIMFRDNTPNTLGMMWNNGAYWYSGTSLNIPVNQWSLVALSVAPTEATLLVMNSSGTNTWVNNNTMNVEPWSGPARIGNDSYGTSRTFNGSINEVAVFTRTLSADELGGFYAAAVTAQAAPVVLSLQTVGANLQLSWPQGILLEATNVAGPWTTNGSASPFTVTPAGPQKFYRVMVP